MDGSLTVAAASENIIPAKLFPKAARQLGIAGAMEIAGASLGVGCVVARPVGGVEAERQSCCTVHIYVMQLHMNQ